MRLYVINICMSKIRKICLSIFVILFCAVLLAVLQQCFLFDRMLCSYGAASGNIDMIIREKAKEEYLENAVGNRVLEKAQNLKEKNYININPIDSFTALEFAQELKLLIADLIELRSTLDDEVVGIIEEKYNNFQRMLMRIENKTTKIGESKNDLMENEKNNNIYYCPEKIIQDSHRRVFTRSNCSKIPIPKSVTIIIHLQNNENRQEQRLLREIDKLYENITIIPVFEKNLLLRNRTPSRYVNEIITRVKTPFVYVARHLSKVDKNLDLERLLNVISMSENTIAAGGAMKNSQTGIWSNGCLQTRLKSYTLSYKRGYYNSINSCLECDELDGSFITKTAFLRQLNLTEELKHGYYEDWFLKIKKYNFKYKNKETIKWKGRLYSCTDVMTHEYDPKMHEESLEKFADLWDIKKILKENGEVKWFGCKRNIKNRKEKCAIGRGMEVPPCCLENLADAVKFVMAICENNSVMCELKEGTLLGAVKFSKVLPWERDADILFLTENFEKLKSLKEHFETIGYELKVTGKYNFFRIRTSLNMARGMEEKFVCLAITNFQDPEDLPNKLKNSLSVTVFLSDAEIFFADLPCRL